VNETDEQLLERTHRGESDAFEALFLRHYERVYRVLYNLVGYREEAEDLAQETFLTLYHHPPQSVAVGGGLGAWLCRVALNRGYNALRSTRRAQQRIERLDIPAVSEDPYHNLARAEERAHVRNILARLPERQRNLLLLRYAGLSYAEIAAALDVAPGSVGTLLARAERAFVSTCGEAVLVEG
jgi:RNA polymerase sigma-70 factor, ECF subfamily